jgi:hypothetical protein
MNQNLEIVDRPIIGGVFLAFGAGIGRVTL